MFIIGLTFYGVFKDQDLGDIASEIIKSDLKYILFAVLMVLLFVFFDSLNVYQLLRKLGYKRNIMKVFMFSACGFFFAGVTPGGCAMLPSQVLYMRKDGIAVSASSSALVFKSMLYKSVLIVVAIYVMIFHQDMLSTYLGKYQFVFYLGFVLNIFFVGALALLFLQNEFVKRILHLLVNIVAKTPFIKDKQKAMNAVDVYADEYKNHFITIGANIWLVLKTFGIAFIQRSFLSLIPWFVYRALGLSGRSAYYVFILQMIIYISTDMLPIPGGQLITEILFSAVFTEIFGAGLLVTGMVLSRGIAYYSQILICLIMTMLLHIVVNRRKMVK